jgi:signal transduction histidine kinase
LLQLTKTEQDIANSWSTALERKAEENIATGLANAIRGLSAMVAAGEECLDVCAAAAQCAATMLPGSRAIVFEIHADRQVAEIKAKINANFLNTGQELALASGSLLQRALNQPGEVQQEACGQESPLSSSSNGFPGDVHELLLAKAIPRDDTPAMVIAIVCDPEATSLAEGLLLAFSELLVTLSTGRRATLMHNASLGEIARAKQEWERTVDLLPEVVCLVDQNGIIVRANRTLERWGLGRVNKVRGLHVHSLFHEGCESPTCALRDSVSVSLAAQAASGYLQSAVTNDPILKKTLIVHTRLMADVPVQPDQESHPCAVVVVSDISALLTAKNELATLNQELEARVAIRTQELESANKGLAEEVALRRAAERDLQVSRDELGNLSQQLIHAQEEERQRLSRELHDSLGQSLGAIKYSLERVAAMHGAAEGGVPVSELTNIVDSLGEAIRETRSIAVSLRPPMLDELGTASAIRTLCQQLGDTYPHIAFHIEVDVENSEIPAELATPVFRIVQEALNNVIKHAEASAVLVALRIENDRLKLEVLDDGIGFEGGAADTGSFQQLGKFGRTGMRERAANSQGSLEITSWPGEGTKVIAEWMVSTAKGNSE